MKEHQIADIEKNIRRRFYRHISTLGYHREGSKISPPSEEKTVLRALQSKRRSELLKSEKRFIKNHYENLKSYFASGDDIDPESIKPTLVQIDGGTEYSDLFRLAGLTWGVPVSAGYGRRMRFLVLDKYNGKLIGLIGLADPVFNLSARDNAIGWAYQDRKARLVDVLNAYILGAVPPYNMILGGKLVSSLVRTREVKNAFSKKYKNSKGILSQENKKPSLLVVTTSSSLGKSAIYDRIKLEHKPKEYTQYFTPVGYTLGWGHFHIPDNLFQDMRLYLELIGHPYANGYKFGNGSNWRLRASEAALKLVGVSNNYMNHGVKREVFLCRLASNADQVLRGETKRPLYPDLLSVRDVGKLAIERWVIKRSNTRKEYVYWKSEDIKDLLDPKLNGLSSLPSSREFKIEINPIKESISQSIDPNKSIMSQLNTVKTAKTADFSNYARQSSYSLTRDLGFFLPYKSSDYKEKQLK